MLAYNFFGYENKYFEQSDYFRRAFKAASNVDVSALREQGFENMELADKIREERIRLVKAVKG